MKNGLITTTQWGNYSNFIIFLSPCSNHYDLWKEIFKIPIKITRKKFDGLSGIEKHNFKILCKNTEEILENLRIKYVKKCKKECQLVNEYETINKFSYEYIATQISRVLRKIAINKPSLLRKNIYIKLLYNNEGGNYLKLNIFLSETILNYIKLKEEIFQNINDLDIVISFLEQLFLETEYNKKQKEIEINELLEHCLKNEQEEN